MELNVRLHRPRVCGTVGGMSCIFADLNEPRRKLRNITAQLRRLYGVGAVECKCGRCVYIAYKIRRSEVGIDTQVRAQ